LTDFFDPGKGEGEIVGRSERQTVRTGKGEDKVREGEHEINWVRRINSRAIEGRGIYSKRGQDPEMGQTEMYLGVGPERGGPSTNHVGG